MSFDNSERFAANNEFLSRSRRLISQGIPTAIDPGDCLVALSAPACRAAPAARCRRPRLPAERPAPAAWCQPSRKAPRSARCSSRSPRLRCSILQRRRRQRADRMGRHRPVGAARCGERDDAPPGRVRRLDRCALRPHLSRWRGAAGRLHRLAVRCARGRPASRPGRQSRPAGRGLDRDQLRAASPAAVLSRARGGAARGAQEAAVLDDRRRRPDQRSRSCLA